MDLRAGSGAAAGFVGGLTAITRGHDFSANARATVVLLLPENPRE
jgi:hypothetical protein